MQEPELFMGVPITRYDIKPMDAKVFICEQCKQEFSHVLLNRTYFSRGFKEQMPKFCSPICRSTAHKKLKKKEANQLK